MKAPKVTKQGVRDLGGNSRVRQPKPEPGCTHLWEVILEWDCHDDRIVRRYRCGFCQDTQ